MGDIINLGTYFSDKKFDAVIDVACLQHNSYEKIRIIISIIYKMLKSGGKFFGIMLAENSWGFGSGEQIEENTFININEGPLIGKGLSHFFTLSEIKKSFNLFNNLTVDFSHRSVNSGKYVIKHWIVQGEK